MQAEKKKLNMFNIYTLGVGGAIGSGIFVMMGLGIAYTGRSIFLAVAIGCLYMLLAYFYHPIMSSMFVLPGGSYDMGAMLQSPAVLGMSAVFSLMGGFAMAMYGLAIVDYLAMVIPGVAAYSKLIGAVVMTLFFAATIKGSKFVAVLNSVMTVVLLVAIAMFVIVGLPQLQDDFFAQETFFMGGGAGFIQAISIMSFACQGTTMGPVSMMAVTIKPKRTIPIAILFITLTVGVVYGLMGVVASGVLPVAEVAGQNLALVAKEIFPGWLYPIFIIGGAVFAIATSLIGSIAMLRYPTYQVAEDGWLPKVFTKTTKNGYPWVIQLVFYLLSVLPILFGFSLDAIVSLVMIPSTLINAYMNVALILLVKKYPKQWKNSVLHMPMPVFSVLCILAGVCNVVVAFSLFMGMAPMERVMVAGMCILCAGIGLVRLKTGAVKKEDLLAKREAIAQRALDMEKEIEMAE